MEMYCMSEICLVAWAELDTRLKLQFPKPTELQTPIPFLFNHLTKFKEAGSGITASHKVNKMDTGKQEITQ
jgi:hypothetical protein